MKTFVKTKYCSLKMGCFYQDKVCIFSITKGLTNKLVACILYLKFKFKLFMY